MWDRVNTCIVREDRFEDLVSEDIRKFFREAEIMGGHVRIATVVECEDEDCDEETAACHGMIIPESDTGESFRRLIRHLSQHPEDGYWIHTQT